jgi:hypothetical protein
MTLPVWVEQRNGTFTASVLGAPGVCAVADSREKAVDAIRAEIESRLTTGELLLLDVKTQGMMSLAGRYAGDEQSREMWDELVAEIYRQRDEEKAREFPE